MREQDFGVSRRTRAGEPMRERDPIALEIVHRAGKQSGTIHRADVLEMDHPRQMGVRDRIGEDLSNRVLSLDGLGQEEARPLRPMRRRFVLARALSNDSIGIVERNAQARVRAVIGRASCRERV